MGFAYSLPTDKSVRHCACLTTLDNPSFPKES